MMKWIFLFVILLLSIPFSFAVDEDCQNISSDILIQLDEEPYIVDKNAFLGILPDAYKTHSVKCWSYVEKQDNLQQTNPQMQEYSETFFSLPKPIESREYFTAQNGVINAYFTQKNLVSYEQFTLGLRCVSEDNGDVIMGEKCITPLYQDMKGVVARSAWATENAEILFIMGLFILIAVIVAGMMWRKIF